MRILPWAFFDRAGRKLVDANPALARMLGYSCPRELIAENPNISSLYYQQSDRLRVVDLYEQSTGAIEFEVLFMTRGGAVITANLNARAVRAVTMIFALRGICGGCHRP